MDPISYQAVSPDAFQQRETIPAPPDESHISEFQSIYAQDPAQIPLDFQSGILRFPGMAEAASVRDGLFQKVMERMVEHHQNGCAKLETMVERISANPNLSFQELMEMQVTLADASASLTIHQNFEKKTEEGVKTLMTGQ